MSKCCKDACWCKYLPHNWLCLKGLSVAFVVLFYITLLVGIIAAWFLCANVWGMFANYFGADGAKSLLTMGALWKAWAVVVLEVVLITAPLALLWLALAKMLKALAAIKHAVAPCCQAEEETKKEDKAK